MVTQRTSNHIFSGLWDRTFTHSQTYPMTRKKYDTISTQFRKRPYRAGISKSYKDQCENLLNDRHTIRVRTILYLQHRRRMMEPQQHL